jgi:3-hydroxybutyryl-CoA dehydrogenase
MQVKTIGVVGCGLMGSGITQVCAQAEYPVVVSEISDELLQKGLNSIISRLSRDVDKGRLTSIDKDAIIGRIKGTTDTEEFSGCDLVIEAATENIDVKKKIFTGLDKACPGDTILASNTSGQSVTDIAMSTSRPDKVLGLHFFNPVPAMKLVEVIKTIAASEDTVKAGVDFVVSLGKTDQPRERTSKTPLPWG